MAIILASGNGSPAPISVTLTFGHSTTPTTTPPATTPGSDTTPGATTHPAVAVPPKHLPFTGVPAVAELDIALVLAVLGATFVTAVKHLPRRARPFA
jgi:hypothetical protein